MPFTGLPVYVCPPLGPFQGSMTHFNHTAPFGLILSLFAPPGFSCSTTVAVAVPISAVEPIYQTTRCHTSEHISSQVKSVDVGCRTVRYVSVVSHFARRHRTKEGLILDVCVSLKSDGVFVRLGYKEQVRLCCYKLGGCFVKRG